MPRSGAFEHLAIQEVIMVHFKHGLQGCEITGRKFISEYVPMPKEIIALSISTVSMSQPHGIDS